MSEPLSWDPTSGSLQKFGPDLDYGYEYHGKHRATRPWRWFLWALVGQWFAIFALVLLLIWGWEW